ncbi:hypothetical protein [uncultured Croceitalea sp.]|uniref:hypothetical protein n=1 Tax=uncultured Croceitalea sp. TaxID=1798908 RepID=UPI0033062954
MKKITVFCTMILGCAIFTAYAQPLENNGKITDNENQEALIQSIEFIEIEEKDALHAELLQYLPNDFDPYRGMVMDPSDMHFEECCESVEINMDTESYLPKEFNPYVGL